MLHLITQWSVGFSLFSLLLLWLVYWFALSGFDKSWLSRSACTVMLFCIATIQWIQGVSLQNGASVFSNSIYLFLLFVSAPAFFLFSREVLQAETRIHPSLLLHLLPALVFPWFDGKIAVPIAFAIGCGYAVWLSQIAWRLRAQRQNFQVEMVMFAGMALIAALILTVGLAAPWLGERAYLIAYANLTAVVLFCILFLILRFPEIGQKTVEAVAASYAVSTLKNVDCDQLVKKLTTLLKEEKIYRDENLSLAMLAEHLGLSSHQTSELINTQFNMGFSRLVRECRVKEAKRQLRDEPKASVLSIGLAVGFSSQSNFYTAFREIAGETPGQFRKRFIQDVD